VADPRLTSEEARKRAARALCGYAAGALLMPYGAFRKAAEAARYDVDRLAGEFEVSIEQVCHRLVTLRRPGEEGIPFVFLRVDPAGNISKRFSLPTLRLPRYGGVCPLWAVYRALEERGAIATQRVRLPEGREFLFMARSLKRTPTTFGGRAETYSVMLGCDAAFAERFVYADSLSVRLPPLQTGVHCHLCPRDDCGQRAFPQVLATG
jgi:predicted transcriptional regulator